MNDSEFKKAVSFLEQISMVLGGLLSFQLREMEQNQKIVHLSRCGYSTLQVATLLGTTTNAVNVALHRSRKKKKLKK